MDSTKRITKRERFAQIMAIPAVAENADLMDFLTHEVEMLTRKNGGEKKPTKTQLENEVLKDIMLKGMEHGKEYSVADLMAFDGLNGLSCQKISSLMGFLVDEGKVVRSEHKRKVYFSLA